MDLRTLLFGLVLVISISSSTRGEDDKSKKDSQDVEASLTDPSDLALDKRTLLRYGRSHIFRYGKRGGGLLRYGKRGGPGIMRWGKRDGDDSDDVDSTKRLFRWGKRSDDGADEADNKRIFRWGKRGWNSEPLDFDSADFDKRKLFRWGKRGSDGPEDMDAMKRKLFRYGKRGTDGPEDMDAMKRKLFRWGKRSDSDVSQEEKRRLLRYGRNDGPHVPFRFGEDEDE